MDFPAYVPGPVRLYLTAAIDGEYGLQSALDKATETLNEINFQIESCTRWGKEDYLLGLAMDKSSAKEHQARLNDDLLYLRRLAHDARMGPAFTALNGELKVDDQWLAFIEASRVARDNFDQYRDQQKQAKALAEKIAVTARNLASQLGELADVGVLCPDELFHIPALLRQTDNPSERNRDMWRSLRGDILGDLPPQEQLEPAPDQAGPVELVLHTLDGPRDIEREIVDALRYAWRTAPRVQDLLSRLSEVAHVFTPTPQSEITAAAIQSRQRSRKTEYLRAFWHILNAKGFTKTAAIQQAMAATANVALNDTNIDVTYDDVRKTLERVGS